eukprot:sb/3476439/
MLKEVHTTPDDKLHLLKEEMNPRNAVASIDLMELERYCTRYIVVDISSYVTDFIGNHAFPPSCNRLEDKTENHSFCVITNDRVHYFSAENSEEMFRWIDLLSPQVLVVRGQGLGISG